VANKSLDILIRVLTQEVGPQKAAEVVKRIRDETEKSTRATREHNIVNREAGNVLAKTRDQLHASTIAAGKSASATQNFTVGLNQLRAAARGAGAAFPGLTRLATAFLNPVSAGFAAAAFAVNHFMQRIILARQAKLALAEAGRFHASVLKDEISELDRMGESIKDFNDKINEARGGKTGLAEDSQARIDALRKAHSIQGSEQDALTAAALAEVDTMAAAGSISAGDAAARKKKITGDAEAWKRTAQATLDDQIVKEKEALVAALKKELPALEAETEARRKAVSAKEREVAGLEQMIADDEAEIQRRNQWAATHGRNASPESVAANLSEIGFLNRRIGNTRVDLGRARTGLADEGRALFAAERAQVGNVSASSAAGAFIASEAGAVASRAAIGSAASRQRTAEAGSLFGGEFDFAPTMAMASQAARQISAGRGVSAEEGAAVRKAIELTGASGQSRETILAMLEKMTRDEVTFRNALRRIASRQGTNDAIE